MTFTNDEGMLWGMKDGFSQSCGLIYLSNDWNALRPSKLPEFNKKNEENQTEVQNWNEIRYFAIYSLLIFESSLNIFSYGMHCAQVEHACLFIYDLSSGQVSANMILKCSGVSHKISFTLTLCQDDMIY